jgi:hypothetical protein
MVRTAKCQKIYTLAFLAVNCGGTWSIFPGYEISANPANCSFGSTVPNIYGQDFGGIAAFYQDLGKAATEGCIAKSKYSVGVRYGWDAYI